VVRKNLRGPVCVNISRVSSVVSGPDLTRFIAPHVGEIVVDNAVFLLSISSSVPETLRSKSEVVRNRADFWTVFALSNSMG